MCKSTNSKEKKKHKKCKVILQWIKWVLLTVIVVFICFLLAVKVVEPIIVNGIFGCKPFETLFTENEWFAFSASYLGAIGSVFVGVIALVQSKKYKEQADEYTERMDKMLLLAEVYPIYIKKRSIGEIIANYVYLKIDGIDDRVGECQDYDIQFIVIKNPVINLRIKEFTAIYYKDNLEYQHYDRKNNKNKVSFDIKSINSFVQVDQQFIIRLGLPKVNANYQSEDKIPDTIKVYLKLEYENQYGMICQKDIELDLDEKWSKQTTDRGAYPTWHIQQAQILQGGKENE